MTSKWDLLFDLTTLGSDGFSIGRIDQSNLLPSHISPAQAAKIRRIASALLDSKRSLQLDGNVQNASQELLPSSGGTHTLRISASSRRRVMAIARVLEAKYQALTDAIERTCTFHPNVEGVYNPLQVIRDRKESSTNPPFGEVGKSHSVQDIPHVPLACNVFSSHSKKHRHYSFIWAISVQEFVAHTEWRQKNWLKMRDPRGKLWFPHHASVFSDAEIKDKVHASAHSLDIVEFAESSSRDKLTEEYVEDTEESPNDTVNTVAAKNGPATTTNLEKPSPVPPIIVIDASDQTAGLNATSNPSTVNPLSKAPTPPSSLDPQDEGWASIVSNLQCFDLQLQRRIRMILQVYPQYNSQLTTRLEQVIEDPLGPAIERTLAVSDYNLPEFRQLQVAFSDEIKLVIHLINNDFSIKVDHLLASSDRAVGEINTSLSMELFKVTERIDRLNSAFGGTSARESVSHSLNDHTKNKLFYVILETIIVVVLRLVWVAVNIYKVFAFVGRILLLIFI